METASKLSLQMCRIAEGGGKGREDNKQPASRHSALHSLFPSPLRPRLTVLFRFHRLPTFSSRVVGILLRDQRTFIDLTIVNERTNERIITAESAFRGQTGRKLGSESLAKPIRL